MINITKLYPVDSWRWKHAPGLEIQTRSNDFYLLQIAADLGMTVDDVLKMDPRVFHLFIRLVKQHIDHEARRILEQ